MLMVKLAFFLVVLETKHVPVLEAKLMYPSAPKILVENMGKVKNGNKMNVFIKTVWFFNVFSKYFQFCSIFHPFLLNFS